MKSVGIICEYNPFHYGHIFHLKKIKEMFPNHSIILVLASSFMQRGEASIIHKWDKTKLALLYGIDLVVELPFAFGSQSADIFAKGSIQILDKLKVEYLIFGSETNNIDLFTKIVDTQIYNKDYNILVKKFLDEGLNYPTAMSLALTHFGFQKIDKPNDLLALSYIKEIKKIHSKIKPISILRTNDYHKLSDNHVTSASSIRILLKEKKDISNYVPKETLKSIKPIFTDDLFSYFKYKVLTTSNLDIYETVDEGLQYRIKKYIKTCTSLNEFIDKVKTKRYTYNRIMRMIIHILCNFTKEENEKIKDITYIRVLGFNDNGKKILNEYHDKIPLIYHLKDGRDIIMDLELRATSVYQILYKKNLLDKEYKSKPVIQ